MNKKRLLPAVKQLFGRRESPLSGLVQHAKLLQAIDAVIQTQLSDELRPHCRVANYRKGVLVLELDSGIWATHLRYRLPELREKLRQQNCIPQLRSINYYVGDQQAKPLERIKSPPPSKTAIDGLGQVKKLLTGSSIDL